MKTTIAVMLLTAVASFPLSGGRLALRTIDAGRSAIEIFTALDAASQVIGLSDLKPAGIVRVSPGAKYLLILPDGAKSNMVVIRTP